MKDNTNLKEIYVTKPYLPDIRTYQKYLEYIWENGILTNKGPLHEQFRNKLSNIIESENINLFCNGHNALECALKSLDLKPGGEIITTPFTFISTTHAIINAGFKPVFCDIKESDLTIDEEKIEELITENTVAVLPVHVYGFCCNVKKIQQICDNHNLKLVYDAAHAFGVLNDGKSILSYGDISIVSFHATKLFHTIEGGMTVSKDAEIAKKQELIKNFGISGYESVDLIGGNSKMNEFSAAMGLATIDELGKIIKKRGEICNLYRKLLYEIPGIRYFENEREDITPNNAYFPILIDESIYGINRDEVDELLKKNHIHARKYFYPLTSDMNCYKEKYKEFSSSKLDVARKISSEVLTLPLYYDLEEKDVKKICKVLKDGRKR